MATSDELFESGEVREREGEVGWREGAHSGRSFPDALTHGVQLPGDHDDLEQCLTDTRARTQALIAEYVESCAKIWTQFARRREEPKATRERIRADLNASIACYARLLRALDKPPERMLVHIKVAFTEAAPHQDDDTRELLEDVVRWAIEAYYAG